MARVHGNIMLRALSGMIGRQLVLRRLRNGTVVLSEASTRAPRAATPAQVAHQARFREAIRYAKGARGRPEYEAAAEARGVSAFNVATSDFFHAPEILGVDVSGYPGEPTIAVTAVDDVKVASVSVRIVDDEGAVVEQGQAAPSAGDPRVWIYTATVNAPPGAWKVVVEAADLAGRVTSMATST
jgi:hypothetical protein